MDSKWNASTMIDTSKPPSKEEGGTIVVDPVGLLNLYETKYKNNLRFCTLTPYNSTSVNYIDANFYQTSMGTNEILGIRPSINLKPEMKIVAGDGTKEKPFTLELQ